MNESKNYPILYHYIPIYNLILLLKEYIETGKFYLKTNLTPYRSNEIPVVSLTRNPKMNSRDLALSKQLCRITLDGNILSNNYKMKPFADSTYTDGSDGEEEEMLYLKNDKISFGNSNNIPMNYIGDVRKSVIRIDILSNPYKEKDRQGYLSWTNKLFDYKPLYTHEEELILKDHNILIKKLYLFLKENKIDIPINIVSTFSNYKYQDRYIDKWHRNGYFINNKIKMFESFKENDWIERRVAIPREEFFKRFFSNKEFIKKEGNYIFYKFIDKKFDEVENEYFWETEMILKVDGTIGNETHYFEKTIISRPLYKTRDNLTREQELKVRQWCGTKNQSKQGKYIGHIKGLAVFKSYLSGGDGKTYHVLPNGDIIEMMDVSGDGIDDKYKEEVINYLLDTNNYDLLKHLKNQNII